MAPTTCRPDCATGRDAQRQRRDTDEGSYSDESFEDEVDYDDDFEKDVSNSDGEARPRGGYSRRFANTSQAKLPSSQPAFTIPSLRATNRPDELETSVVEMLQQANFDDIDMVRQSLGSDLGQIVRAVGADAGESEINN